MIGLNVHSLTSQILALLCALVTGLLCSGSSARAAIGEPPKIAGESAEAVRQNSATIIAQIDPDKLETKYHFEYGETTAYGSSLPIPDADIGSGEEPVTVTANLMGLRLNWTYHYRAVAVNETGVPVDGPDQQFTTLPAASIDGEATADVTATSAVLQAQINPLGSDTHYYFQYGTSNCGTSPATCTDLPALPGADIGSAETDQRASMALRSLLPDTTYYFRIIATNALGTVEGSGRNFTTYPPARQFALPDDRAYELVSPTDKNGGDVGGEALFGILTNALGQSSASGDEVTYVSASSFGNARSAEVVTQYLSTRGTDGWSTQNISPPASVPARLSINLSPFHIFSNDLSVGVLDWTNALLANGAPPGYDNLYVYDTSSGSYRLVTTIAPPNQTPESYSLTFAGASSDLSHIVFEANDVLVPPAPADAQSVYEWVGGTLRLVSILPGAGEVAAASAGAGDGRNDNFANDVSADGSRIFWTDNKDQLYVREDGTQTIKLNASQRSVSLGDGSATFRAATPDGSNVLFTDGTALTNDPNDNGGGIYEYNLDSHSLTDLTPDGRGAPGIEGVLGTSDDGSTVYFVARDSLAGGASPGNNNLYVVHGNTITFVAALSSGDGNDWTQSLSSRTARVTPDGEHVAFMSEASLTGFDNTDVITGNRDTEVFAYDASSGRLICASCNPSGERPIGPSSVPSGLNADYVPRYISNDGARVFFNSEDALLPYDTNGQQDVYEYESGQVYLISAGNSDDVSAFADASDTGDDVFFTTRSQLVPEDRDANSDMYDARVGGGFQPPAPSPAPCSGEACRGPLSAAPLPVEIATAGSTGAEEEPPTSSRARRKSSGRKHAIHRRTRKAKRSVRSKRRLWRRSRWSHP